MMSLLESFRHRIVSSIMGKTGLESWGVRVVMDPDRRRYRGGGAVANAVICTEVLGNNGGIYCGVYQMPGSIRIMRWWE